MRTLGRVLTLTALTALGACQKTGEGEYQVKGPDVDKKRDTITVGTDTATVRTPDVDAGMKKDTLILGRPTVDVRTPAERKGDITGPRKRL
jgi:hypothetical protein